jgi:hypothetical protein
MKEVNDVLKELLELIAKARAASAIRLQEEQTPVLTKVPTSWGTEDKIPFQLKKQIDSYSGELHRDGPVFAWLKSFLDLCVELELTERASLTALRRCCRGRALDVIDSATDLATNKNPRMIDVVRDLESSFGDLQDPIRARSQVHSCKRQHGEKLLDFSRRLMAIAKMATRLVLPLERRSEEINSLVFPVLLANVKPQHKTRYMDMLSQRKLQGSAEDQLQVTLNMLMKMELADESETSHTGFVNAVSASSGDASALLRNDEEYITAAVQQVFRSRHPSARGRVAVSDGHPQVRDRTPSAGRARTPSRDRLQFLNDKTLYDPRTRKVHRIRTPSRDRAYDRSEPWPQGQPGERGRSPGRGASPGRGRSPGRGNTGPQDPVEVRRRQSKSPHRPDFAQINYEEVNVRRDMCSKCGLFGHKHTDRSCNLYDKAFTTRCTSCRRGGHSSLDCPIEAVSKNE